MNLEDLNNPYTDKNTHHSYLPLYNSLLLPIKETANSVLEIGVNTGGSLKLWYDYFTNATIYGCDINDYLTIKDIRYYAFQYKFGPYNINDCNTIISLKKNDRVVLNLHENAYKEHYVKTNFKDKNIKFDFIIDDGAHTLQTQKDFITLYSPLLKDNGILIIEDVQDIAWLDELKKITPENLKPYIKTFDVRKNKGRYDDIVFTIDKVVR